VMASLKAQASVSIGGGLPWNHIVLAFTNLYLKKYESASFASYLGVCCKWWTVRFI
jgi:hypothetical protein